MTTKLSKYMLAAMAALMTLMVTSAAYAQSASPEVAKAENARWYALAAALGLGIAAFGGAPANDCQRQCGLHFTSRRGYRY